MSADSALSGEISAMRTALGIAASPDAPHGPNPRVGCVLLAPDGTEIGQGYHRGAGTSHAEVMALQAAGAAARGSTAVVTLEPCAHQGRTGPCVAALLAAGVVRVVFGQSDPNPAAEGGAEQLRAAGIQVVGGVFADEAESLNPAFTFAMIHGRPFVTWKVASTLDGRVAAADGSSRWITGAAARAEVHAQRARVDAIVVGTGTVLVDDPALTARDPSGGLLTRQPIRVVMGRRFIPSNARVRISPGELLAYPTQEPAEVLTDLSTREVRHVLLEGGPTLAAAFLRAGLVDRIIWYVAPKLLGGGPMAVGDLAIATLAEGLQLAITGMDRVGEDVRFEGTVKRDSSFPRATR